MVGRVTGAARVVWVSFSLPLPSQKCNNVISLTAGGIESCGVVVGDMVGSLALSGRQKMSVVAVALFVQFACLLLTSGLASQDCAESAVAREKKCFFCFFSRR